MTASEPRKPIVGTAERSGDIPHRQPVRSFVRREGRMTGAQARAMEELWPRYGLSLPEAPPDYAAIFGRAAPLRMEIGFGSGEALLEMARAAPEANFLGVEVHRPGVGRLLLRLAAEGIGNVRVYCEDATEVLARAVAPDSLEALYVFFPDPWPKKRHHKRRLLQQAFVREAARRLRPGGCLHVATDWADYAEGALQVLGAEPLLLNLSADGTTVPRPPWRTRTRFEVRGERLGHDVYDLVFRRRDSGR